MTRMSKNILRISSIKIFRMRSLKIVKVSSEMYLEQLAESCRTRYGFQVWWSLYIKHIFLSIWHKQKHVISSHRNTWYLLLRPIGRFILKGHPYKVLLWDSHSWHLKPTINSLIIHWLLHEWIFFQLTLKQAVHITQSTKSTLILPAYIHTPILWFY